MVAAPDTALVSMQAQGGPQNYPEVPLGGASEALQLGQLAATESCCASLPAQLQHHTTQHNSLACSSQQDKLHCAAVQLSTSCCFGTYLQAGQ